MRENSSSPYQFSRWPNVCKSFHLCWQMLSLICCQLGNPRLAMVTKYRGFSTGNERWPDCSPVNLAKHRPLQGSSKAAREAAREATSRVCIWCWPHPSLPSCGSSIPRLLLQSLLFFLPISQVQLHSCFIIIPPAPPLSRAHKSHEIVMFVGMG